MDLGQRISRARKDRELTQRQVAEALGVTVQAVSLWETNKAFPPGERLRRLATLLGVSSMWLAGDDGVTSPDRPVARGSASVAHLITLNEIVHYLAMKDEERSRQYESVVPTAPGVGNLFAVEVRNYPSQRREDDPGEILIFDTGVVPGAGDYAVVLETEVDSPDLDKYPGPLRKNPVRMTVSIQDIRPALSRGSGPELLEALMASGDVEMSTRTERSVLGVLVEERRLRGKVSWRIPDKVLQGSGGPPVQIVEVGANGNSEEDQQLRPLVAGASA